MIISFIMGSKKLYIEKKYFFKLCKTIVSSKQERVLYQILFCTYHRFAILYKYKKGISFEIPFDKYEFLIF